MRVLLLGGSGMLAKSLTSTAPAHVELASRPRSELDIVNAGQLESALDELRPEVVLNAAAFTQVDAAEQRADEALAVNGTAVGAMGRLCARSGAAVVHFSTDYVFDGLADRPYSEDSPTAPLNVYGETKRAGERALLTSGARALILRTSWLFGTSGRSFARTMLQRASQQLPTRVVDDQMGRPTFTDDLAAATWELVERKASGVVHAANGGSASWFQLASFIFAAVGASEGLTPCASADYPTAARRPRYSVLDTTKLQRLLGRALPPWEDAVTRFLAAEAIRVPSSAR